MEYCVIKKDQRSSNMANKVVAGVLTEYSRHLYGFTQREFDSIVESDLLKIMAFYYSKMNVVHKRVICDSISKIMGFNNMDDVLDNLADFMEDEVYIPLCCKLIDRLGDSRVTMIIYETLFSKCKEMTVDVWNQRDSYSNYLVLLNAAYFNALSYKFHIRDSYKSCMKRFYGEEAYDDFVESLYENHLDDIGWDADIELDVLDELIDDSKRDNSFVSSDKEDFFDATERMAEIRREHHQAVQEEEDKEGFELIVQKTGIREQKSAMIGGFECHFCLAKLSDDEYIIVYQKDTRISDIIDREEEWKKFQHDLYYEDIKNDQSSAMVYIVYILDNDSDNIPIQTIESNKTYGRKYVFSEEETITFINGIVKTSHDEIGAVSPVQEWDRILREEHLTGCLTEAYAAKKVDAYLSGQRFDADYVMDYDYSAMTHSAVPQVKWVKSLDTSGFRDFCFDERVMEFGQINLFFGANGSGKTSVLEAIEYALTAEVRRVKDFKVKLPTDSYPRLYIYDKEAGVHTFTPGFSKKNSKEIERVWYGVPVGRTKTNLNDNFNRFNAFDSEAAYKFIHESDNSEDSFASMFGNLMFGESVVDHEKKWQRFKKAFDEGSINLCFVIGYSGSGKSVLTREYEGSGIEKISLDDLVCVKDHYTMEDLNMMSEMLYSFFAGPGAKYYISKKERDLFADRSEVFVEFIKYARKFASSHKETKFILEGIWTYLFFDDPSKFDKYAVYMKGTSLIKSKLRRMKRESSNTPVESWDRLIEFGIYAGDTTFKDSNVDKWRRHFEKKKETVREVCAKVESAHPGAKIEVEIKDSYFNMLEKIKPHFYVVERCREAMLRCGIEPRIEPIRGGTDGATLSFKGLPCPNICAGGHNFHGVYEYISCEAMAKITGLLVELARR